MSDYNTKIKELLGDHVINGKKEKVSVDSLVQDCETIGIYFSAHWCPPCRGFTPELAKVYNETKAQGKKFEIVFASSDSDQKSFDEYFGEMPWLALPYEDRERKEKLASKFKVSGIPCFVLLHKDGNVNISGRSSISMKEDFPWKSKSLKDICDGTVKDKEGTETKFDQIFSNNDYIMFYFSASWCGPCVSFTPSLDEFYKKNSKNKKFEIVFVSGDREESSMLEYFEKKMSFKRLEFNDKRGKQLMNIFDIDSYPTLVVVDTKTNNVITNKGRAKVSSDPEAKDFPWMRKPYEEFTFGEFDYINTNLSLIALMDSKDGEKVKSSLEPLAKECFKEDIDEQDKYISFAKEKEVIDLLRGATKSVEDKDVSLVIMEFPKNRLFAKSFKDGEEISTETVKDILKKFVNGELETKKFR